jgi:HK97 family phage prohead protease
MIDTYFAWSIPITKSLEQEDGVLIEGYASTKDTDRQNEVFLPEAFEKSLPDYMANPVVLFNHKRDQVIGQTLEARTDSNGLAVKALITASPYKEQIMKGELRAFSWVGYGKQPTIQRGNDGAMTKVYKGAELFEISVVPIPVNPKALFRVAKSIESLFSDETLKQEKETMEIEKSIEALMNGLNAITEVQKSQSELLTKFMEAQTQKQEESEETKTQAIRKGIVEPKTPNAPTQFDHTAPLTKELVSKAFQENNLVYIAKGLSKKTLTEEEQNIMAELTVKALTFGMSHEEASGNGMSFIPVSSH